jgi:hypothetical protein
MTLPLPFCPKSRRYILVPDTPPIGRRETSGKPGAVIPDFTRIPQEAVSVLKFLSSLFAPPAEDDEGPDRALIDAAIERAVDGTDRRLRALDNYRRRLREPVERAVDHVIALVDAMPAPTEISAHSFGADPRIRAFFSSVDHLHSVLGKLKDVRQYQAHCVDVAADEIFGLLVMQKDERTVLGMELEGDAVRKDVVQVAVSFSHHRYIAPASSEKDTRWELKKRAFDFLIERALEQLALETRKRVELDRQRCLLRRKLDALRAGNWGLGSAWPTTGTTERTSTRWKPRSSRSKPNWGSPGRTPSASNKASTASPRFCASRRNGSTPGRSPCGWTTAESGLRIPARRRPAGFG